MATIEKGLLQIRRASLATTTLLQQERERPRTSSLINLPGRTETRRSSSDGIPAVLKRQVSSRQDDEWMGVQTTLLTTFKRNLEVQELIDVCKKVKYLLGTDIGPTINDIYKNQILVKGLTELKDAIKKSSLQQNLESTWKKLYHTTLPTMEFILLRIETKGLSVRESTLIAFRDIVVLQCGLEDDMDQVVAMGNPSIRHMLLVVQSVMESYPPNEQFLRIERMLGQILPCYLGYMGLYEKSAFPVIKAHRGNGAQPKSKERASSESHVIISPPSTSSAAPRGLKHLRQTSTPSNLSHLNHISYLSPVAEQRHRPGRLPSPRSRRHANHAGRRGSTPDGTKQETKTKKTSR